MNKIIDWLYKTNTDVYINDENDEIISEHTNGELLFGTVFSMLFIIIVCVMCK